VRREVFVHATVYSSFDPADPLQNCIAVDDDGGVGACPLISFQVPAATTYTIVVTSFSNGTTGDWQANFTGTVPVELTHIAVESMAGFRGPGPSAVASLGRTPRLSPSPFSGAAGPCVEPVDRLSAVGDGIDGDRR
jgi:hypothetical protein